jgi:hypothetical protein
MCRCTNLPGYVLELVVLKMLSQGVPWDGRTYVTAATWATATEGGTSDSVSNVEFLSSPDVLDSVQV